MNTIPRVYEALPRFKVAHFRTLEEFDKALNNPPENYKVDGYAIGASFIVVYRLEEYGAVRRLYP